MWLCLGLPKVVALGEWNPLWRSSDIGDDKVNTPGSQQTRNVVCGEPSDTRGRSESIVSPQLCERHLSHDFVSGVHVV
jgi:hypothetical protein